LFQTKYAVFLYKHLWQSLLGNRSGDPAYLYLQKFPPKFPDTDTTCHFLISDGPEGFSRTVPENKINLAFLHTFSGIRGLAKTAGYCLRYDLKVSTTHTKGEMI